MKEDPTIERIRKTRHDISEQCDHDPKKLIEYYKNYQKKSKNKLPNKVRKAVTKR
jgi:hypothetical protein